jgi:hypothetical protein
MHFPDSKNARRRARIRPERLAASRQQRQTQDLDLSEADTTEFVGQANWNERELAS